MELEIKKRARHCSVSERELAGGEKYYSALIDVEGEITRKDISAKEWTGPPDACISWWQSRIPDVDPSRYFWAPDNVIIDFFERFQEKSEKLVEQYVLALLLIQKRIFRLQDLGNSVGEEEMMSVSCPRRNTEYSVPVANPSDDEIETIQAELIELLFSDEPFDEDFSVDDSEPVRHQESTDADIEAVESDGELIPSDSDTEDLMRDESVEEDDVDEEESDEEETSDEEDEDEETEYQEDEYDEAEYEEGEDEEYEEDDDVDDEEYEDEEDEDVEDEDVEDEDVEDEDVEDEDVEDEELDHEGDEEFESEESEISGVEDELDPDEVKD